MDRQIPAFLAKAAVNSISELDTKAIVSDTFTGRTVLFISALRPKKPIFGICYSDRVKRELMLSYGVFPYKIDVWNFINKAIDNYKYSLKSNTGDKAKKIETSVKLGNIFFNANYFNKALQSYEIAKQNITKLHPYYESVNEQINTLNEIAKLSQIAYKDNKKKNLVLKNKKEGGLLDDVIVKMKEKEEESSLLNVFNLSGSGKWYFNNEDLVKKGINDFQQAWGEIKLEDNWRRQNKEGVFSETDEIESVENEIEKQDSTKNNQEELSVETPKDSLKVKVLVENEINSQELSISQALLADIYNYRIKSLNKSIETYNDHLKVFPQNDKNDFIYQLYLICKKDINYTKADFYKNKLLNESGQDFYKNNKIARR